MKNEHFDKKTDSSANSSLHAPHSHSEAKRSFVPFYFYVPTMVGLIGAAIISKSNSPLAVVGLIIIGWLSWGLFEYAFHRFVLHHRPKNDKFILPGNKTHFTHHANPHSFERAYIPLHEGVPVAAAYCLAMWFLTGSWQTMAFLYAGFISGYLLYEWLDYEAHHGKSRSRIMRFYRKYHLQHHFADEAARYGVTSPVFDYLFGTYNIKRKPHRNNQPRNQTV